MLSVSNILLYALSSKYAQSDDPLIWPLPSEYTIADELNLNVDMSSFKFSQNTQSEIINEAFTRYTILTFPHSPEGSGDSNYNTITGLSLTIQDASEDTLGYGMDESYILDISASGGVASLDSNTVWGALRGLETFSQLIVFNFTLNYYQTFVSNITDSPRFSHRGILIDTSRHFQPVQSIKNILDSMSYAKFNVLHWVLLYLDVDSIPFVLI